MQAKPIREENEFGGVRVTLTAFLEAARIPLQVDIGFGDAVVPEPQEADFPTLLEGYAAPHLLVYQKETTIAEKLHAMVTLERGNSRMKDFFDLYVLSQECEFIASNLCAAIRDAFARRGTAVPVEIPDGLSNDFAEDAVKLVHWKAFLKQNVSPLRDSLVLPDVIAALATFLLPVLSTLTADDRSNEARFWPPVGPWKSEPIEATNALLHQTIVKLPTLTGSANENIDADLAREYTDDHADLYQHEANK